MAIQSIEEAVKFLSNENTIKHIRSSDEFKRSNDIWNKYGFNHRKNIGDLMKQIGELNPENEEEWYRYYLNPDYTKGDYDRGRDLIELQKIADEFNDKMKEHGLEINRDAMEFVLIRTMYETYQGQLRERNAMEELQKMLDEKFEGENLKIVKSNRNEDVRYNVDAFVVNENGDKILGLQIKSEKFQKAFHNNIRKDVTQENQKGFEDLLNQRGIPSVFVFADKQGQISHGSRDYIINKIELAKTYHEYDTNEDHTAEAFNDLSEEKWDKFVEKLDQCKSMSDEWKVFMKYEKELNEHMYKKQEEQEEQEKHDYKSPQR